MKIGSKGSQKTTQTFTPHGATGAAGTQALNMAQGVANTPYNVPVAPVAGFSDDQLSAFANMRAHQGAAQPYMNAAAGLFGQSASPISASHIANYLNPFANFQLSNLRDLFGRQMRQATGQLTQAAGGVGADRIGVAQSNLAKQQADAYGGQLANIYGTALTAAQQDQSRAQAAGFGLGQLGPAVQQALMSGTQGLFNFGSQQQQLAQAQANAPYQWELGKFAHQFQVPQWLSQLTAQTGPALGGTTTNTYPGQSPWGTIAGLGMAGLGAFMGNPGMMKGGMSMAGSGGMGGASQGPMGFGGYQPGYSAGSGFQYQPSPHGPGAMAPMAWARGGRVPRSQGGAVNPYDIGQAYQTGGGLKGSDKKRGDYERKRGNDGYLGYQEGGGIDWNAQPPDVPPEIATALATGAPIPEQFGTPTPPPAPPMVPQGQPALPPSMRPDMPPLTMAGMPSGAMPYAPMSAPRGTPPWLRGAAGAPPAPPQSQQQQPQLPYGIGIPPDPGEGSFARSPWASLMKAGLATMAAAGQRDSRGLPLPPLAAIGAGGVEGMKHLQAQGTEATRRRTVELQAQNLLRQAMQHQADAAERQRHHRATEGQAAANLAAMEQYRRDMLDPSRQSPILQALRQKKIELGRDPTYDEMNEVFHEFQRMNTPPQERPGTPENRAIDALEKRLGRPATDTEISDLVSRMRRESRPERPTRTLPTAEVNRLQMYGNRLDSLGGMAEEFKENYGGRNLVENIPIVGDWKQFISRQFKGIGDKEAAAWWSEYAGHRNEIRHGTFGSTLTPGERAEWAKWDINPGMDGRQIREFLIKQNDVLRRSAARRARAMVSQGYDPGAIEQLIGVPLDQLPPAVRQQGPQLREPPPGWTDSAPLPGGGMGYRYPDGTMIDDRGRRIDENGNPVSQ